MAKAKTLQEQKMFLKNISKIKLNPEAIKELRPYDPYERILNEDFIGRAIMECLMNNDPAGVIEIIGIHLEAKNIVRAARNANISRSTLYHTLKSKNPTLKTLAKIMHASQSEAKK